MPILFVAITAMLIQQTVATTAKVGIPSLIPAVARTSFRCRARSVIHGFLCLYFSSLHGRLWRRDTTLWCTSNKPVRMRSYGTWPSALAVCG